MYGLGPRVLGFWIEVWRFRVPRLRVRIPSYTGTLKVRNPQSGNIPSILGTAPPSNSL